MKPCAKNQKLIAWLVMDTLDASAARDLRAHLAQCPGCRQYFAEMSQVTGQLAMAEPKSNIRTSESFHRAWTARIKTENKTPLGFGDALAALRQFRWRITILAGTALPVLGFVAILAIRSQHLPTPPTLAPVGQPPALALVTVPDNDANLSPALANYQRVAGQSLDKLDDLLLHQERQTTAPATVCTASAMSLNF